MCVIVTSQVNDGAAGNMMNWLMALTSGRVFINLYIILAMDTWMEGYSKGITARRLSFFFFFGVRFMTQSFPVFRVFTGCFFHYLHSYAFSSIIFFLLRSFIIHSLIHFYLALSYSFVYMLFGFSFHTFLGNFLFFYCFTFLFTARESRRRFHYVVVLFGVHSSFSRKLFVRRHFSFHFFYPFRLSLIPFFFIDLLFFMYLLPF